MNPIGRALAGGVTGALTATLLNESVRRIMPHAPRMDVIGERALGRTMEGVGLPAPEGDRLKGMALAGDLASNSLYYSAVGLGSERRAIRNGAILGLIAGIGAATLPRPMGLGTQPGQRTPYTQFLTVAWYTIAGLAAGRAFRGIEGHAGDRR